MHSILMTCARWPASLLLIAMWLTGCAPTTRVILLPDEDGQVGAVSITSGQVQQRLNQAYAEVTVGSKSAAPSQVRPLERQSFQTAYAALLEAQPDKPKTFILNFETNSMELTPESKALLPEVLDTARARQPTEVTVFGHADAAGNAPHNLDLSAMRARKVAALLRKIDANMKVDVQYFGDRAPLVPSSPGKAEPRNRRAEILIL